MRIAAMLVLLLVAGCSGDGGAGDDGGTGSDDSTSADPTGSTSNDATGSTGGTGSGSGTTGPVGTACNGSDTLCDRPYDQVVFPGTHNSMAATEAGFSMFNANHHTPLAQQLEDGVRVMLLDVTYDGNITALCHGPCALGSIPHAEALGEIRSFLEANPREILTIIYQDSISEADMEADFVAAGLVDLVFTHADGDPWPTLGEMVDANTRLVVTAESGGPPPAWYHHVWDVAWDTPYSFMSPDEFSCALNRGSMDNDLFLVNHWVNTDANLPSEDNAMMVNQFDVLHGRVTQCQTEAGRIPNFVAIDYYEHGDLFAVADALNGL